jgi:hypothetical protein
MANGKKMKHLQNKKKNLKTLPYKQKKKKLKNIKKEKGLQNLKLRKRLIYLESTTLEDQTW